MTEKEFALDIKNELIECNNAFAKENDFISAEVVKGLSIIPKNLDIEKIQQECNSIGIKTKFYKKPTKEINSPSLVFYF